MKNFICHTPGGADLCQLLDSLWAARERWKLCPPPRGELKPGRGRRVMLRQGCPLSRAGVQEALTGAAQASGTRALEIQGVRIIVLSTSIINKHVNAESFRS